MKMRKFMAFVLAIVMVFSMCSTAFAVKDEDADFEPGTVMVGLKSDVKDVESYESILPELDIEEIEELKLDIRMILVITLKEKTTQAVLDAIEALKDNPYVEYAEPNYYVHIPDGEGPTNEPAPLKGDASGDYLISNVDLVLMARLIVSDTEITKGQMFQVDMNWDGKLSNADLILLAKKIVSFSDNVDAELTEEMEEKMISDFIKQNYEEDSDEDKAQATEVVAYFGTYGGCEAVLIERMGISAAVEVNVNVNGLRFTFPHPLIALYLYKDSQFLEIDEAYEAGWITAEELQSIWNLRDGDFGYSGKNNKEIAEELEKKIIDDFNKQNGYEDAPVESEKVYVDIRAYYGTYSGCEAVLIRDGDVVGAVVVNVDVNGHRFSFPDPATAIYLYKDSQFLRIDEAYEEGWITSSDVLNIWNLRGGFFAN